MFRKLPPAAASGLEVQRLAAEVSLRSDPKQAIGYATRAVPERLDPKYPRNAESECPPDASAASAHTTTSPAESAALAEEGVLRAMAGKTARKVIVVPDRVINVVV